MTPIEITGSSAVTTRHDREPLLFFFRRPRGVRNRHNAVRALAFRQASRVSERLFYPNPQSPTGPQPVMTLVWQGRSPAGMTPDRRERRPALPDAAERMTGRTAQSRVRRDATMVEVGGSRVGLEIIYQVCELR
jgi:hypothetical protein